MSAPRRRSSPLRPTSSWPASSAFFFSSRRRHTRWPRDWSSDVCSSDLYQKTGDQEKAGTGSHQHLAKVASGGVAEAVEIGRASCRERVELWEVGQTGGQTGRRQRGHAPARGERGAGRQPAGDEPRSGRRACRHPAGDPRRSGRRVRGQLRRRFFFQAEDGIRDGHVTGVQTCALPIYTKRPATRRRPELGPISIWPKLQAVVLQKQWRSEERRVGKEWSSGRSARQEDKQVGGSVVMLRPGGSGEQAGSPPETSRGAAVAHVGTPQEILAAPADEFVASFVGVFFFKQKTAYEMAT